MACRTNHSDLLRWLLLIPLITFFGCSGTRYGIGKSGPFANSRFVGIDGAMLHYRIWPAASGSDTLPWLFMVHGFSGSTWSWENNAPVLAGAGFNVLAADVPPFGYSDKDPDRDQSAGGRAGLLWQLLDRLRPGQVWHLAGHSMGGGIVQAMAILKPDQVGKVVFADPALFDGKTAGNRYSRPILRFRPVAWIAAGIGRITLIRQKKVRELLVSAYGQDPPERDVEEYYKALSQKGTALAIIRSGAPSGKTITLDGKAFGKPAIAIWGEQDTWVPVGRMQPILDQLASVRVIIIPEAGHCPMATHPERFNREVIDFLQSSAE